MKIVLIGPAHPLRGGLAAFNERLAREFQAQGDEVELFTFSLQYPNLLFPGKTQYTSEPKPADLKIEVAINSINPFNWWAVGRRLRAMKPDLVICRYWLPFMAPCLGTILRGIRKNRHTHILGLIDNIIPHERRIGDAWLTRYFVKPIDSFVVMSKSVEAEMPQFIKASQPVAYIPHPVYDSYGQRLPRTEACAALGLDPARRYVLFFGFIRDYKGLDLLLQALATEWLRTREIHLILAGEYYGNAQKYQQLIEQLGLGARVHAYNEYIPDGEVCRYFSAADLVVQPYRTATQSGISQMAYHFESPMVVTDVGGLAEIVPHGRVGYVVQPEPERIAEAVADFFDQNRAVEFAPHLAQEKQRFSWEAMAEGMKAQVSVPKT